MKVAEFNAVAVEFSASDSQELQVKTGESGTMYFGVHKDKQSYADVRAYRRAIFAEMGFLNGAPVIQVLGDTNKFGTRDELSHLDLFDRERYAGELIARILNMHPGHVAFYGMTGSGGDVNSLFSNWVAADPRRKGRVLGNAVSVHTPSVIQRYNNTHTDLSFISIVYPHGFFSDDIKLTDYMVPEFDGAPGVSFGLCLEGGVQSFMQIVNLLSQNVRIVAVTGLRGDFNVACEVLDGQYHDLFSAAEFLSWMGSVTSREQAEEVLSRYLLMVEKIDKQTIEANMGLSCGLRWIVNPNRIDYPVKLKMFKRAFEKFLDEELWVKFKRLVTVYHAEEILISEICRKVKESSPLIGNTFLSAPVMRKEAALTPPSSPNSLR